MSSTDLKETSAREGEDDNHKFKGSKEPNPIISSKSSKFETFLTASVAAISNVAKAAYGKDTDGCTRRGCQFCFWTVATLLIAGGIMTCLIFVEILLFNPISNYFISEVSPSWPVFSNIYAQIVCCIVPLICGIWLIIATFWSPRKLSRCYYIISSWLLILPLAFTFYFIFYLGQLGEPQLNTLLRRHIADYDLNDVKIWDKLQSNYKCCGIEDFGWTDWTSQPAMGGAVPKSCCSLKHLRGCPELPSNHNTWSEGCLKKLLDTCENFGAMSLFALCYVSVIMSLSIFAATRFFVFFHRQEVNDKYNFHYLQYFQDCCCPCCLLNQRNGVKVEPSSEDQFLRRSTENAFIHHVEHHGMPVYHKPELETRFSIIKQNNNMHVNHLYEI